MRMVTVVFVKTETKTNWAVELIIRHTKRTAAAPHRTTGQIDCDCP